MEPALAYDALMTVFDDPVLSDLEFIFPKTKGKLSIYANKKTLRKLRPTMEKCERWSFLSVRSNSHQCLRRVTSN
jgi:hypothetical protein